MIYGESDQLRRTNDRRATWRAEKPEALTFSDMSSIASLPKVLARQETWQ